MPLSGPKGSDFGSAPWGCTPSLLQPSCLLDVGIDGADKIVSGLDAAGLPHHAGLRLLAHFARGQGHNVKTIDIKKGSILQ